MTYVAGEIVGTCTYLYTLVYLHIYLSAALITIFLHVLYEIIDDSIDTPTHSNPYNPHIKLSNPPHSHICQ